LTEVRFDALVGALVVLQDATAAAVADKHVCALLHHELHKTQVSTTAV
jgi:hypothetical protein